MSNAIQNFLNEQFGSEATLTTALEQVPENAGGLYKAFTNKRSSQGVATTNLVTRIMTRNAFGGAYSNLPLTSEQVDEAVTEANEQIAANTRLPEERKPGRPRSTVAANPSVRSSAKGRPIDPSSNRQRLYSRVAGMTQAERENGRADTIAWAVDNLGVSKATAAVYFSQAMGVISDHGVDALTGAASAQEQARKDAQAARAAAKAEASSGDVENGNSES